MDLLKSLSRPEEVVALFKFKMGSRDVIKHENGKTLSTTLQRCYTLLGQTSRSFASVIQALDEELRHAVCIFYLVLRALDTVEDDMTIPLEKKVPMLEKFHTFLLEPDWKFLESNEKDKMVLEQFPAISTEFRNLSTTYREVISDICHKMGCGMVKYLDRAPSSMEEWDEYCHYVAGLVGMGLSRLFSASRLESPEVGTNTELSNSMGLFLQKTNIIRDYLEDITDKREFWPKEAWGKYSQQLSDLADAGKRRDAISCLNELVTHALQHVPDVMTYLSSINNQSVFNFCAIPQVMAIATLERCYNNPAVFTGVVKIRKGEAVRMMIEATSMDKVRAIFAHFLKQIQNRIPHDDPSVKQTRDVISRSLDLTDTMETYTDSNAFLPVVLSCAVLSSALVWQYWAGLSTVVEAVAL